MKLKESIKRDKYLDLTREMKKIMEHEGNGDADSNWCTWNNLPKLIKRLEDLEIRGQEEAVQTRSLLRSVRILRRVLETCWQSKSSENHLLTLVWTNPQKIRIVSLTSSWVGFDPRLKCPACLATLKSCDTTKQSFRWWQYIRSPPKSWAHW